MGKTYCTGQQDYCDKKYVQSFFLTNSLKDSSSSSEDSSDFPSFGPVILTFYLCLQIERSTDMLARRSHELQYRRIGLVDSCVRNWLEPRVFLTEWSGVKHKMALSLFARYGKFRGLIDSSRILRSTMRLESTLVETERIGNIFLVSIARPEKRNAVDSETATELANAFRSFEIDGESTVAVLYGKGGTFCSGYDLEELSQRDPNKFLKSIPPVGEGDAPMVRFFVFAEQTSGKTLEKKKNV